jgi:hypothetical protein
MSAEDEAWAALAQVVNLGDVPTQQELALGDAVMAHINDRPNLITRPCPTCGGTGRIHQPKED